MTFSEEQQEKTPEETQEEETPEEKIVEKAPKEEPKEDAPKEEVKEEAPAEEAPQEEGPTKGDSSMPRQTETQKPTDCKACDKALKKHLWYYRNGEHFCNIKCFKKKTKEDKEKAEEAAAKAKAEEAK